MRTETASTSDRMDYPSKGIRAGSSLSPSQRTIVQKLRRKNIVLVVLSVCLLVFAGCESKEAAPQMGPPEVEVAAVVQQTVPIFQEWVAQLNGPVNAEITPKVQGYLLRQDYQNGYFVKKGQLMFDVDPRQYPGRARSGQGGGRRSRGQPRADAGRRGPRYAAGGAKRDSAKAARQRCRQPGSHGRRS